MSSQSGVASQTPPAGSDAAPPSTAEQPSQPPQPPPRLTGTPDPDPDSTKSKDNGSESPGRTSPASAPTEAPATGLSHNHIITAASVVLVLLVLRAGTLNLILLVLTSAVLLINPYVRTFLDLPATDAAVSHGQSRSAADTFSAFDPAKYFAAFSFRGAKESSDKGDKKGDDDEEDAARSTSASAERQVGRSEARGRAVSQLEKLPPNLDHALDQIAPLIIRDFIQGWYNHHSFGHPSFPRSVRSTIDYMVASMWTKALTSRLHSVDVATELLLTGSSVFLTCIRRKRMASAAAAAGDRAAANAARRGGTGHWNNNEERIASLRSAMQSLFERHLPPNERESDLLFSVVTEILTKQLWNLILTVGEPDFLNRSLVEWKQGQMAAAQQNPDSQQRAPSPLRPLSRMSERSAPMSRPPSVAPDRPHHCISRPPSTVPERPPSVPARPIGAGGPSISIPDRSMISSPPSRADSPMMPSFISQGRGAAPAHARVSSPVNTRNGSDHLPTTPQSPTVQGPSSRSYQGQNLSAMSTPASGRSRADAPPRTSSELSDGFSAVVGGLGSVIKGVGKGADALVGGVGDAFNGQASNSPAQSLHATGYSPNEAWRRSPSAVDRASSQPGVLQNQHNAIRKKQPPKKENDLTDLMAAQAAWPSNLPATLGRLAEGEDLPESLKSSLKQSASRTSGHASNGDMAGVTKGQASPPRMNAPLPYEVSPRQSVDSPSRSGFRTQSPPVYGGQYMSASMHSQPKPSLPARPPSTSSQMGPPSMPPRPHPGMSSLPPAPSLSAVLSRSDSQGLYDAFEAFLENPPPSVASVSAPGEGEELLRLQIGLGTIERLVPEGAGEEAEMFREDASTILSKARDGLRRALASYPELNEARTSACHSVLETLDIAINKLGFGKDGFEAKEGTVRDALQPVQQCLQARLKKLFDLFWKVRCEAQKEQRRQSTTGPSMPPSMNAGLSYEPRRREPSHTPATPPSAPPQILSRPSGSGLGQVASDVGSQVFGAGTSGATPPSIKRTSLQAPKPRQAIIEHLIDLDDDNDDEQDHDAFSSGPSTGMSMPSVTVSVTDISANVDRPNVQVDTRTFEFICAVEGGLIAGEGEGGGFVLVRRWAEVVTLDRDLRRLQAQQQQGAPGPLAFVQVPVLPNTKGRTSAMLSAEVEGYLAAILSNPDLASAAPVEKFADRTRAATSAAAVKAGFNPFQSGVVLGRNLGKNLVEGVGAVGKAAASGLQMPANIGAAAANSAVKGFGGQQQQQRDERAGAGAGTGPGATLPRDRSEASSLSASLADESVNSAASIGSGAAGAAAAAAATSGLPTSDVASKSSQGLSARALDALLTSIFALADEALSLTGAWSMRRGVVRLLQSVVRQSYSGAIVSAFDGTASALSSESVAGWVDKARTTFWAGPPDDLPGSGRPKFSYEKGAVRTARERVESEERAREIVVAYAPSQAAFVLGPGGRNACEKALEAVHGVICEDEGALDLALTLTLRLLQML